MPDEQQLTPLPVRRAYDLRALADSSYARCPFCGCKSASTHKPDCTIELAAKALESLPSEKGVSTNLLNKAYTLIEDRRHAYMHEHGSYDDSTGAWEYGGGQSHEMGFDEGMTEALDIIERLRNG